MRKLTVFLLTLSLALACGRGSSSEDARALALKEALWEMPSRAGGCYHSYEGVPGTDTPAPEGYKPFYISHYGRHGSRYHTPKMISACYPRELEKADSLGMLTPKGAQVLSRMLEVYQAHQGKVGLLSARGEREHRGIAVRMTARFPDVFSGAPHIMAVATHYPRCQESMRAFLEGLGVEAQSVTTDAGKQYYELLCRESQDKFARYEQVSARQREWREQRIAPSAMQDRLFKKGFVPDSIQMVLKGIYIYGCQEEDLDFPQENSLFSFFTPEELFAQWTIYSDVVLGELGPSEEFADTVVSQARSALALIVDEACAAVSGSGVAAHLRFAHDNGLVPLLSLMGVEGYAERVPMEGAWKTWPSFERIPMASNLQMVFYRNAAGDVLVKLLFNEKEVAVSGLEPFSYPYYTWDDLAKYLKNKAL